MEDRCEVLVIDVLNKIGEADGINNIKNPTRKTKLLGINLDSIGIVLLSSELEEKIYDTFKVEISLADDRVMSQKTSPFRDVETLSKYISKLILEKLKQ